MSAISPHATLDVSTIVATWTFTEAPSSFAASVMEVFTDGAEQPAVTAAPSTFERISDTQWLATIALANPGAGRGFRLRPTAGDPVDVGTPAKQVVVRGPDDPIAELRELQALLAQQPDGGREILRRMLPSADPDEMRRLIDAEAAKPVTRAVTRAVWPFTLGKKSVDRVRLDAFLAAYDLPTVEPEVVGTERFQTKEDWERYATAKGGAWFMAGGEVDAPPSEELREARGLPSIAGLSEALTYQVDKAELKDGALDVAMYSDNGNGLYHSLQIVNQIVKERPPYAFHLGDVYYGGTTEQFEDYFTKPIAPMLEHTELFAITGNHEMFGAGTEYKRMLSAKREAKGHRQRQLAESFRVCGDGFQMIALDTMFVGWRTGRMRLHDYADDDAIDLLRTWLDERPNDLTILMTTNEAWDFGAWYRSSETTRLYDSLRETIAGRVDLWFWGNVHYAALYDAWPFADTGSPTRQMITTCIGHGGYPFYTEKDGGKLPPGVTCRWKETRSRFWPDAELRPEVGLNGWCRMKLVPSAAAWTVELTYVDWVGRPRLRTTLVRPNGGSIGFASVEESDIAEVGGPVTWRAI